jgi:hypothetical protein
MGRDFLAAKERDLTPLLEESSVLLEFDYEQTETMEDFLDLAWAAGTRSGRDQMEARATQPKPDVKAVVISRLEADFKKLMEQSADALNLTVPRTITMWGYLHEAWMAGNRTCETELMALYIELKSDVGEEAQQWLESGDGSSSAGLD